MSQCAAVRCCFGPLWLLFILSIYSYYISNIINILQYNPPFYFSVKTWIFPFCEQSSSVIIYGDIREFVYLPSCVCVNWKVICELSWPQVFLVRKLMGPDAGQLYAMKVLKKASLKGQWLSLFVWVTHFCDILMFIHHLNVYVWMCCSEGQSSH